MEKDDILSQFSLFSLGGDGIGGWLTADTDDRVFTRLAQIQENPLSNAQLNQLLVFGHQAPVSQGFFSYYWLKSPSNHPYSMDRLKGFDRKWLTGAEEITSLSHLKWGMLRLFTDALLYFGNVRTAFRVLRVLSRDELESFFAKRRFDTKAIKNRGDVLTFTSISRDDRYLISEMASKSFGDSPETEGEMLTALKEAYESHKDKNVGDPTFRQLITGNLPKVYLARQKEFKFSMDDILDEPIRSEEDFIAKFDSVASKYFEARKRALANTEHYLSMANDLDVYVATSMRVRDDFRDMASFCERVFGSSALTDLHLRYFDPTLSAALGHEDKGLIECLMVKCAKVLVYCAGKSDSYGKDAEAAMALSLGKPVIFYCDEERRSRFYREVHPLSRLIEFETGVAVGAMVTDRAQDVVELLRRLFNNDMQYSLKQHPDRKKYLRIEEGLTGSVVRVQTDYQMLTETFWNHYHNPASVI